MSPKPGELPGVRSTMDQMIRQEIASRPGVPVEQIRRDVQRAVTTYDRAVRDGREPPPKKRD